MSKRLPTYGSANDPLLRNRTPQTERHSANTEGDVIEMHESGIDLVYIVLSVIRRERAIVSSYGEGKFHLLPSVFQSCLEFTKCKGTQVFCAFVNMLRLCSSPFWLCGQFSRLLSFQKKQKRRLALALQQEMRSYPLPTSHFFCFFFLSWLLLLHSCTCRLRIDCHHVLLSGAWSVQQFWHSCYGT